MSGCGVKSPCGDFPTIWGVKYVSAKPHTGIPTVGYYINYSRSNNIYKVSGVR